MKKILYTAIFMASLLFSYTMDYDKKTTCVVRNLQVNKSPEWVSKIELVNGKKIFFSSPKSMFEFYFRPGKWFDIGVKSEEEMKDIVVTDFATKKPINARGAFFVYGSTETSPAGDDLVAFEKYDDAKIFAFGHKGKRIFGFNEVKEALINLLNGKI